MTSGKYEIDEVLLRLIVFKLRRAKEGQQAQNSCLRLLSSLSADHAVGLADRNFILRQCLRERCLICRNSGVFSLY